MALSEKSLESMLKAVDIIASKRADDKAFDSTVICTIINNSDRKNGCYIVTDGAIKFKAYSEVTTYQVDDQVRVSIPNGDYTQDKYIEGKYVSNNDITPITYVSTLDSIVRMGDLSSNLENVTGELVANGNIKEIAIGYINLAADSESKDLQENSIYDTFFLQADFRSLLNNMKISSGNYGLRLECQIQTQKDSSYMTESLYLDSSEMLGNPYSFTIFSTQSKRFSLKDFGTINKITIYFYQSNNFIADGIRINYLEGSAIKNLFVKNIKCGFGADITTIPDNTVQLYSSDSTGFKHFAATNETNTKRIDLLWYNKNEDNQYLGFTDGVEKPDYDEVDYLNLTETERKIIAQKGKGNIPTDRNGLLISANAEESFSILESSKRLVEKDLKNTIEAFRDRLIESQASESFGTIFGEINDFIAQLTADIANLKSYFENNLTFAYQVQKVQQGELETVNISQLENKEYYKEIIRPAFNENFKNAINSFITQSRSEIDVSFYGIHDVYNNRITEIIQQLDFNYDQLDVLLRAAEQQESMELLAAQYNENDLIEDYTGNSFTKYDNHYCIYWYRYVKGFYSPDERFMGEGWQCLNFNENFNVGNNDKSLTLFLDPNNKEEKFIAIVFHNHEMYKSNELIFVNTESFEDPNSVDKAKALQIMHGHNSSDNYQTLYSSNNLLRNSRDALIPRELQLNYNGMNEGNEALIGAGVYWYVPNHTTMIDVDDLKLQSLNFTNDKDSVIKSSYYREGYTCFYKKIETEEDTYFYYRLKNYYSPTFLKNTIFCLVEKQEYPFETDITFNFGTLGTSGTDYTLVVAPSSRQTAIEKIYNENGISESEKSLSLSIGLYDYNNNPVDIYYENNNEYQAYDITIDWVGPTAYNGQLIYAEGSVDKVIGINIIPKSDAKFRYGILKITVTLKDSDKQRIIDLSTLYPIAWSAGAWSEENQYSRAFYIEGTTTVVYDSYGTNPDYYKDPYKIFWNDTNSEVTNVTWRIISSKEEMSNLDNNYMPIINAKNSLIPSNLYIDGIDWYPVVQCYDSNGNIIWSQPIVIMQNRYPSPMLNAWDGSFTIDEDKGTILSTMIGAGRKTTNNTFEGVLMGNLAGDAGIKTGLGIYGFNDGVQSFGLNIDGTAFFGKSSGGRIEFDGNSGAIKSAGWNDDCTSGMKIDLDDGIIDIRGVTDNGFDQIKLNASNGEEESYFLIKSDNKEILHIGKNNYFLQSKNYSETSGMKIDLTSGILECVGAKVSGDITATSLTLSGCQIPASDINGLSPVATTGEYDDLSGKPKIPSSVEELGFDPSNIMYKGDITQSTQEDKYGNSYLETQVPTGDGGYITYATYNAGDYLIFGYSRGTDTNGTDREGEIEGYFCVSTDGLLTAKNALIYGTIYATDGEFIGDITARSLTLSGFQIPVSDIDGLSSVATSGSYNDLSNKPTIKDLDGASNIIYKGDITQSIKKDTNEIEYVETIVPTEDGNITYSTYDADDYIIFGRSKGTDKDGKDYIYISKDGLLTARNALIYGTVFATDGEFTGKITAKSLTLSGFQIPVSDINGLSKVATSGSYNDLSNKPKIQNLDGASNIMYKGDITQSTQTDEYGNSYLETIVPTENGNITYATYNAGDYLIFGQSRGTDRDGKDYICISEEGLLTARNALIYGTVFATDGEFTGKITANEGKIGNWFIGTNGLYDADPNGTTSVFLVPGGKSISDSNDKFVISVGQYSNFNSTDDGNSYFGVTTTGKLYAKGGTFKGHLNAWSGTIGGCTISGGKIKGTGWEVSGAGIAINGVNMTTLKTASIPVYTPYTDTTQGGQKRPYISSLQSQSLDYLIWTKSKDSLPAGFQIVTRNFVTGGTSQEFQSNTYKLEYIGKAPITS